MLYSGFSDKKVWAVVGNVHDESKYAFKIFKFLRKKGYVVYGVNPTGKDVEGEKTFKSLLELPEKPEAVNFVINPIKGKEYLEEAKKLEIGYIWFQPGAETNELIELSRSYGMNVVHNACVLVEFA